MDIHPTDTEILELSTQTKPCLAFSWGPLYETMQELKETGDNDYDDPVMKRGFALFQTLEKAETIMQIRKAIRQANFSENEINKLNSPCFDGIVATVNNDDPIVKLIKTKSLRKYVDTFKFYLRHSLFRINNLIYLTSNITLVKILIEVGANIFQRKNRLLTKALNRGRVDTAKLLLDHGIDIHHKNNMILNTVTNLKPDIIKFLIDNGIRPPMKFFSYAPLVSRDILEPYIDMDHRDALESCCKFAYSKKIQELLRRMRPEDSIRNRNQCIYNLTYYISNYIRKLKTPKNIPTELNDIFNSLKLILRFGDLTLKSIRELFGLPSWGKSNVLNTFSELKPVWRELFLELVILSVKEEKILATTEDKKEYGVDETAQSMQNQAMRLALSYDFPNALKLAIKNNIVTVEPQTINLIAEKGQLELLEILIERDETILVDVLIRARYRNHVHILEKYKDHIKSYYKSVFEDESLKFTPIKGADTDTVWNDFRP